VGHLASAADPPRQRHRTPFSVIRHEHSPWHRPITGWRRGSRACLRAIVHTARPPNVGGFWNRSGCTDGAMTRWRPVRSSRRGRSHVGNARDIGRRRGAPVARPTLPIRRFAYAVRAVIQLINRSCGVGGNALHCAYARTRRMARLTGNLQRIRRERATTTPAPSRDAGIIANRPNHVWLIDLTVIPGLFRATTFYVAVLYHPL
jgi:hypothetical protein